MVLVVCGKVTVVGASVVVGGGVGLVQTLVVVVDGLVITTTLLVVVVEGVGGTVAGVRVVCEMSSLSWKKRVIKIFELRFRIQNPEFGIQKSLII